MTQQTLGSFFNKVSARNAELELLLIRQLMLVTAVSLKQSLNWKTHMTLRIFLV